MSGASKAAGIPGRGGVSLGARFVLLAVVALILMFVDHRQDHLQRVRALLSLAVYPIQVAVDLPFSTWDSLSAALADRSAIMSENEQLRSELRFARLTLQDYEALKRENERLRGLVSAVEDQSELDYRMAEIVAVDLENRQRLLINRGANDGVKIGQPLIDAEGIVGQVMAVYPFSSEALLITDTSHRIQVVNTRTGERTIAQGTGDSGTLRLLYVTNDDDIAVGDELETTGLGGVFPRGRLVARVTSVERQPGQSFASVLAAPVADLDRDQEVLLVWSRPPAGEGEAIPLELSP